MTALAETSLVTDERALLEAFVEDPKAQEIIGKEPQHFSVGFQHVKDEVPRPFETAWVPKLNITNSST